MANWKISSEIEPNYAGGLMRAKWLIGGVRTVKTLAQRNAIPALYRYFSAEESTIVFVEDESQLYRLNNNPSGTTTNGDWTLITFGNISSSLAPIGTWNVNNTDPTITDTDAAGTNGSFYFVTGAPTPQDVTIAGLFEGATTSVVDGNMIVSVGTRWVVVSNSTAWNSIDKPQSIIDYVAGTVIAHSHTTSDISDLGSYLTNYLTRGDVADPDIDFESVPDTDIITTEFLKKYYYLKSEVDSELDSVNTLWANIIGVPNTIAGFGITDASTTTYIDSHLIGKSTPSAPGASQNGKSLRWNNSSNLWEFFTPGATTITAGVENTIPYSNSTADNFNYDDDFYYIPTRQTLVAGHDIVFSGAGLTPVGGGNAVVIGDNLAISADHSWSAIFGSFNTLAAVFNESIMAGGGHSLSDGPLGGAAIFGSGHTFSGASYKLYNLISGTSHVFNTTQEGVFITNRSDSNFMFGTTNTINGTVIKNAFVGGQLSHALGTDVLVHGYPIAGQTTRPIIASGIHSVNISANTSAQIPEYGALGNYSAIIGGYDHHIPSNAPNSVIIGGTTIVARAADPDNVYVPYLNITQIEQDDALTQILVRDETTGKIHFKDSGTLGGGSAEQTTLYLQNNTGTTPDFSDGNYIVELKTEIDSMSDDVVSRVYQSGCKLTGSSGTFALNFNIPVDTTCLIISHVVARRTGGSSGANGDSAAYELKGLFKNVGGVISAVGTPTTTVIGESQAGWDCVLTTIFGDIAIMPTGATNNNTTWHAETKIIKVDN